jgi:cytohesin
LYACGGADIIKACKTDSEGKVSIDIHTLVLCIIANPSQFSIFPISQVVEGKHTVYRMSAATDEEKQEWIKCLQQSISHNPFYDILVQRKKKALAKS